MKKINNKIMTKNRMGIKKVISKNHVAKNIKAKIEIKVRWYTDQRIKIRKAKMRTKKITKMSIGNKSQGRNMWLKDHNLLRRKMEKIKEKKERIINKDHQSQLDRIRTEINTRIREIINREIINSINHKEI